MAAEDPADEAAAAEMTTNSLRSASEEEAEDSEGAGAGAGARPAGMGEYEWRRLQNIRQNQAQLEALFEGSRRETGLLKKAAEAKALAAEEAKEARKAWMEAAGEPDADEGKDGGSGRAKKRRRRGDPIDASQLRRSSRVRGGPRAAASLVKLEDGKPVSNVKDAGSDAEEEGEALEKAPRRPGPEDLRARLNAIFAESSGPTLTKQEANARRDEAIRRWGPKVIHAEQDAADGSVDWDRYVVSRNVVQGPYPQDSPLALLQERYAQDTWKLLIACCLMSRVSSAKVKEKAIEGFFALCPTPSAALDAPAGDVRAVLAPLGLFDNRYRSVMELSSKYLLSPAFQLDLAENKVYGFGAFAFDSYLIFTRGMGAEVVPQDKNLRAYCAWAKAQAAKEGSNGKE